MSVSTQKLKDIILRDRYNSIVFKKGRGRKLYLVGGYLRGLLRGIHSMDRDYIIDGDAQQFAKEIRRIIGGSLVRLGEGHTVRLAFRSGVTLDFSRPMGTLEEDLSKRDFTINAIAWSPDKGIIDLYKGVNDINKKIIRMISAKNFIADPLRILRTYRFAAELNGSIEKDTRKVIKILHDRVKEASSERITLEFFNLLNSEHTARYLRMALSDRLLSDILSIPYRTLEHNIKGISALEARVNNKLPSKIQVLLKRIFSQNLTYKGLLCLELLLKTNDNPVTVPKLIKMSNAIRKRIELFYKGIKEFREGKGNLFDVFLASKDAAIDILIIKNRLHLLRDYERFQKIWKKGILSSGDIVNITGIKHGPRLGSIIIELKKAQFEGKVRYRRSATEFVRTL